jgi:hypothetical protein
MLSFISKFSISNATAAKDVPNVIMALGMPKSIWIALRQDARNHLRLSRFASGSQRFV